MSDNMTFYELTPYQRATFNMRQNTLHDQTLQIPFYMIVDKKLDFELLKRAIALETERNDCLRLFYRKRSGGLLQYFRAESAAPDIRVCEFSSQEEQESTLSQDAGRALRYKRGEIARYILFRTPEGKTGIYICVFHLNMDAFAVLLFFSEIAEIYRALAEGEPMPAPLCSFEDAVKRDIATGQNERLEKRDVEFYRQFFAEKGPTFMASIAGMVRLNKERRRKRDPELRCYSCFDPLHSASIKTSRHIGREECARIQAFCAARKTSLQSVIYLGMRTHLSKINDGTDDVMFQALCNRRITRQDKRSGGCRINSLPLRTVIPRETTFDEALGIIDEVQLQIYRHSELPTYRIAEIIKELENRSVFDNTASMLFTCYPLDINVAGGWSCELGAYSAGYLGFAAYAFVITSPVDGGMDFHVEHQPDKYSVADIELLIKNTLKVIDAGISSPSATIGEIIDSVL